MAQVIIRNIEDEVVAALKQKADLHGRSLEQELRDILRSAAIFSAAERVKVADRLRAMTPPNRRQTDSTRIIRELRDSR